MPRRKKPSPFKRRKGREYTGRKYWRKFGCVVFFRDTTRLGKIAPRRIRGVFLGYDPESPTWIVGHFTETGRWSVLNTYDAIFHEDQLVPCLGELKRTTMAEYAEYQTHMERGGKKKSKGVAGQGGGGGAAAPKAKTQEKKAAAQPQEKRGRGRPKKLVDPPSQQTAPKANVKVKEAPVVSAGRKRPAAVDAAPAPKRAKKQKVPAGTKRGGRRGTGRFQSETQKS